MHELIKWFCADIRSAVEQFIGFLPLILTPFIFLKKDRRGVIVLKACTDLLWAMHFYVMGSYAGGLVNTVNMFRDIIFSQKDKWWASAGYIPVCFCLFTVLCAMPGFSGVQDTLPVVGSCLAVIGFWQQDVKKLRIFNLLGVLLWLVYSIRTVSVASIAANTLSVISIVLAFVKEKKPAA